MSRGAPWKHKLALKLGRAPEYAIGERPSKKNKELWTMEVWHRNRRLGSGRGYTKKDAEQQAACEAYERMLGSSPDRVRQLITELNDERGDYSEGRVATVFQHTAQLPSWFRSLKKAPFALDQRGIDFIIDTTDLGDLWLQVKSSNERARNFLEKHSEQHFAVVVVRVNMSDAALRGAILGSLVVLRNEILLRQAAS